MRKNSPGAGGIVDRRCRFHHDREAAARCPECGMFYCRECVTEHRNRVLCADCLSKMDTAEGAGERRGINRLFKAVALVLSFLTIWLFFHYLGRALTLTPTEFHRESLWEMTE